MPFRQPETGCLAGHDRDGYTYMKALFAHDHRFIPAEGEVWSESQFEAALWQRYLGHFDSLTVVARRGMMPAGKVISKLERSSAPNVTFELLDNMSTLRGLTIARPAAFRQMVSLVTAHDAVIARLPSEIGLLAITAAQATGRPWAVEMVGCTWDGLWNYGNLTGRLYTPIAWFRVRRAVRQAEHVIYVTSSFLQQRYPSQAENQAVASNVILSDVSPAVLERRHALIATMANRPLRLGLIGTLQYKGIQTLLAALASARLALLPLRIHILGPGDVGRWKAEAKRLGVSDLVSFDGTLPAGEPLMRWLDATDVYLQPSLTEGLPRALIEAMSRGCPALASTAGGIPELLPAEDLIRPGDAVALAELMRHRLTDHDWMHMRATANWEKASAFRADVLAARREKFWRRFRQAAEMSRNDRKPGKSTCA